MKETLINKYQELSKKKNPEEPHALGTDADGNEKEKYTIDKDLPDFLDPNPKNAKAREAFINYTAKINAASDPEAEIIVRKVLDGTPLDQINGDEFDKFSKLAAQFKDKWEAAKDLATRIDPKYVERMAQVSNPDGDFSRYAFDFGTQKLADIWKDRIPFLIVEDPGKFEQIEKALHAYERVGAESDKTIEARAKDIGLKNGAQYIEIMSIPDAKERKDKLQASLRDKYNGFELIARDLKRQGTGWIGGGLENKGRAELEAIVAEMDGYTREIADVLAAATSENGEVRGALITAIRPKAP